MSSGRNKMAMWQNSGPLNLVCLIRSRLWHLANSSPKDWYTKRFEDHTKLAISTEGCRFWRLRLWQIIHLHSSVLDQSRTEKRLCTRRGENTPLCLFGPSLQNHQSRMSFGIWDSISTWDLNVDSLYHGRSLIFWKAPDLNSCLIPEQCPSDRKTWTPLHWSGISRQTEITAKLPEHYLSFWRLLHSDFAITVSRTSFHSTPEADSRGTFRNGFTACVEAGELVALASSGYRMDQ